jgi:DNA-binding LytR/AlgR family response regulator
VARIGATHGSLHHPCAESLVFFAICRNDRFTMREWLPVRTIPYHLPWVVGIAVVMAVTGPFGTYELMGLGKRLLYFTITSVLSWALVIAFIVALRRIEVVNGWPVAVRMAVAGILSAVPTTAMIIVVHSSLVHPIPWVAYPYIFPQTAFLAVVISVMVGLFVERRLHADADAERARVSASVVAEPASGVQSLTPDFFRRIPPALGRDLLALEMEDHYLRIHTALGSDLILLRLRDALAELGSERGRQVHRSWWVAKGAIAGVEKDAGRPTLVLRNGLRVPVSKSFRDQVKEAGWLG